MTSQFPDWTTVEVPASVHEAPDRRRRCKHPNCGRLIPRARWSDLCEAHYPEWARDLHRVREAERRARQAAREGRTVRPYHRRALPDADDRTGPVA